MNRILENEELKHFEKICIKKKKERRREQKERRKKILNALCWAIVLLIMIAFFVWQFYLHRDMTEFNTHEITIKADDVMVYWNNEISWGGGGNLYPYVDIVSGNTVYHAHPPVSEKERSFEDIINEDKVTLTVKNSDNLYFVGARSESKVYYDTEEHYNGFARTRRVAVTITFCIFNFGYWWFYVLFNHPETFRKISLLLDPPRRKKKPK